MVIKLQAYGVHGNGCSLVDSQLSLIDQYVLCNDRKSDVLQIEVGVPQGSVLGPLLLNIYRRDTSQVGLKCVLFEDDAALYVAILQFDLAVVDIESH